MASIHKKKCAQTTTHAATIIIIICCFWTTPLRSRSAAVATTIIIIIIHTPGSLVAAAVILCVLRVSPLPASRSLIPACVVLCPLACASRPPDSFLCCRPCHHRCRCHTQKYANLKPAAFPPTFPVSATSRLGRVCWKSHLIITIPVAQTARASSAYEMYLVNINVIRIYALSACLCVVLCVVCCFGFDV